MIGSLRCQGLAEEAFESILVNDGSADVSGALCEDFSFMFVSSWLILRWSLSLRLSSIRPCPGVGYIHFFLSWIYPRLDRNRN